MTGKTTQELVELAREIPWRELDREAVDRVRANLREATLVESARAQASPVRRSKAVIAAIGAIAAAVIATALLLRGEEPEVVVVAQEPEVVRLTDGHIRVRAADHGERPMRVVVGDAEIEARAADFDVYVEDDRVVAVFAASGMVEVKRFGATPTILQPGVRWEPKKRPFAEKRLEPPPAPAKKKMNKAVLLEKKIEPIVETTIEPIPEPIAEPIVEAPKTATVAKVEETPPIAPPAPKKNARGRIVVPPRATPETDERYFHKAWTFYQSGFYVDAARTFARVSDDGSWSEDAMYWRAQALLRAEPESNAKPVLRAYLERYPKSPRRGELAVALGWLLVREEKNDEARKYFKMASEDPSEKIRDNARRGWLEAED